MGEHLGEFEQLVMFAVLKLKDDAYGAAIRAEIENRTGRNVNSGAVYITLERLAGRNMVSSRWGEPTGERGGRRRRYYRVKQCGAEALHRSYRQLRELAEPVLNELESMIDAGESR